MSDIMVARKHNQTPEQSVVWRLARQELLHLHWYCVSLYTIVLAQGQAKEGSNMSISGVGGIDSSRIQAMMEQLKAAATRPAASPLAPAGVAESGGATKVSFSDALKNSLDSVNASQVKADELGQAFAAGDDKVNLSDVMISIQKANINMQASVQVRNKLVSAYHEIMNMQI